MSTDDTGKPADIISLDAFRARRAKPQDQHTGRVWRFNEAEEVVEIVDGEWVCRFDLDAIELRAKWLNQVARTIRRNRERAMHIVKPVPMHAVTSSLEFQDNADPQVPIYPETLPGSGYCWALLSACWQVTRSQTMPLYPHDVTMIVSHGRWVWTWERRSES